MVQAYRQTDGRIAALFNVPYIDQGIITPPPEPLLLSYAMTFDYLGPCYKLVVDSKYAADYFYNVRSACAEQVHSLHIVN